MGPSGLKGVSIKCYTYVTFISVNILGYKQTYGVNLGSLLSCCPNCKRCGSTRKSAKKQNILDLPLEP